MQIKTVGIVGYGAFGALAHTLLGRFAPEVKVRVYAPEKKADGQTFFSLAEVAKCDAVILAVPIHAFEEVLKKVLPLTRKDTVIIDVATVKVHTAALLKKMAKGRPYISTHPVWGPESYEKRGGDVAGFRIVMVDGTLDAGEYTRLIDFLKKCGFDVVEMSAEEHDKHVAETLFLTHFIAQIVLRTGIKRTTMDTVSFGWLMNAVETAQHDQELFKDVYRYNPYCQDAIKRFGFGETEVRDFLDMSTPIHGNSASIRVGVAGAKGSFSEEAARAYAKKTGLRHAEAGSGPAKAGSKTFSLDYLISVEDVLAKLEKGGIDLGVFPIENSTGGVVTEAVQGMARHNFKIKKMFDIDIKQNLIVRKGVTRDAVRTITSHEQALKQCKGYLKRVWKKAKIKEYEDTAKAAEDLASGKLPATTAVIASKAAADIYGLKVLEAGIQDLKENSTTFIAATW